MEALRAHQRDVLAADPKQRARELTARAERIDVLARHIADLFTIFRGSALDQLRSTATALSALHKRCFSSLRKTALTPDSFRELAKRRGVGCGKRRKSSQE